MIVNRLIKALSFQQHEIFVKLIKINNITKQIKIKKKMKMLRDKIKFNKTDRLTEMMFLIYKRVKMCGIHQNLHLV